MAGFEQVKVNRYLEFVTDADQEPNIKGNPDLVGLHVRNIASVKKDAAAVGFDEAANQVKYSCLSSSIWSQKSENFSAPNFKGNIVYGGCFLVFFCKVLDQNDWLARHKKINYTTKNRGGTIFLLEVLI